jgi:murein DD-endopeptidase MepM/ murein hydrolase activator NlpD
VIKKVGSKVNVSTRLTPEQIRQREEKAQTMSLSTNDPFQGKQFYRLNLDLISADANAWHYPLDNAHVISGFGGRRHHSGTDIKNGPGTKIYAAFDGKVIQSGVFSGYGKCITIRHRNGLETRYSHNSKNLVTVGEMVKAGQVIGIVGRTGRATTEHVHFETRINGKAFDSSYVFDHAKNTLQKGTLQFKKNGGVSRLK